MTNALKLILKARGMTQTDFAKEMRISKQSVTRWVQREKPMPEYHIEYAEMLLNVKRKYFVDERRRCRTLDANEKLDLEDYLLRQKFEQPTSTISEYKYIKNLRNLSESELARREYLEGKYLIAYKRKRVNTDIQQISLRVKKDIKNVEIEMGDYSSEYVLDLLEDNVSFYQKLMHLRERKKVTREEWDSVLRALNMLVSKEENTTADKVALDIYNILQANRLEKQQKEREDLEFYASIWGAPNVKPEEEV